MILILRSLCSGETRASCSMEWQDYQLYVHHILIPEAEAVFTVTKSRINCLGLFQRQQFFFHDFLLVWIKYIFICRKQTKVCRFHSPFAANKKEIAVFRQYRFLYISTYIDIDIYRFIDVVDVQTQKYLYIYIYISIYIYIYIYILNIYIYIYTVSDKKKAPSLKKCSVFCRFLAMV